MSDGSLRIKTRLDNSGLDKDTQVLENKIKKLQTEISKNSLEQKGLEEEIQKFEQLTQEADEYKQKIKELKVKKGAMFKANPSLAVTADTPEYANIKAQIAEMQQKYAQANIELEKQTPKIEKVYTKLDKVKLKQEENNSKMREYKQKIEEAKRKQLELNYSTGGIGKSINSGITKILRYGMALLSIRSIYGVLTNAMNSWLSGNNGVAKQLKADIDYMKNAIGKALSPVLKYIVNLLYQALGLAGALIKAFTGIDIFAGSVADYMSSTTSSANKTNKELKKQLTSFDKINKLSDDSSSNSSGGSGGVVAPSQDLSQIMNKYTEFAEKVKKVFDDIKNLIPIIGAGILAWKLSDIFFKQLGGLNSLKAKVGLTLLIAGIYMQYKGTKKLLERDTDIFTILETLLGTASGALGIVALLRATKLGQSLSLGQQLKLGFGIMLELQGIQIAYTSMKDLAEGTKDATQAFKELAIGMAESIGAGIMIGSTFGATGAIIGGVVGGIISGISALVGYNSESLELSKRIKENTKEYEEFKKKLYENANAKLSEISNTEKLVDELDSLVDKNGKVKDGYEARVSFILGELNNAYGKEYKLVDGAIEKYDEFKNEIYNLISAKKAEIVLSTYEESYKKALENRAQAYVDLEKAEKEYVETKEWATKEIEKLQKNLIYAEESENYELEGITKSRIESIRSIVAEKENQCDAQGKALSNYNQDLYNYETLETAIVTENKELQQKMINEFTNTVEINGEKVKLSGEQQINIQKQQCQDYIDIIREKGDKITEEEIGTLNGMLVLLRDKLIEQTKTVEDLTDDNIEAWQILAQGSKKEYEEALSKLEPEIRSEIQSMVSAVDSQQGTMNYSFSNLASGAVESFEQVNGYNSGKNLVSGIVQGITKNKNKVTNALTGLANGALLAFNRELGIHSPSRVMADQAKFIPLGIAEGVDSTSDKAVESMKNLVYGMQETVDGMDYSNITQIPKIPKNAITYVPKQAISTNEVQRSIVGQNNEELNRLLSILQSNSKGATTITVPIMVDGEEWFSKTIKLNEDYNLATNGGGL